MGRVGLPGQMFEIRIGTRTLLLGTPGTISPMLLNASDRLGFAPFYARLAQDRIALQRLRAGWKTIAPAARASQMDRVALVAQLRTHIESGRISAALLDPRSRKPAPGKARSQPTVQFAHIRSNHGELVLAPRGQLPQGLRALQDNPAAAEFLRSLNRRDTAFVDLARHAKLLAGQDGIKADSIRSMAIRRLQNGTLDGVVIKSLVQRSRAANVLPKGPDVSRMSNTDKVCEGLLRAGPHLEGDIKAAWEEMTKPENLLIMGGVFAAMGLAQLYPPAGLAIDAVVFITAAFAIGWKSVEMLRAAIEATIVALRAQNEADLDKAGRHYADAFEALGAAALAALTARFAAKGLGRKLDERAAAKAASSAKPKPVPGEPVPPKEVPPKSAAPTTQALTAAEKTAEASTHVAPGKNRLVLGKWPGYIEEAKAGGGTWFETEPGYFDKLTAVHGANASEEAWKVNEAFLKQQLSTGKPVEMTSEGLAHAISRPNSMTARELDFLTKNAESYGYKQVGPTEWVKGP